MGFLKSNYFTNMIFLRIFRSKSFQGNFRCRVRKYSIMRHVALIGLLHNYRIMTYLAWEHHLFPLVNDRELSNLINLFFGHFYRLSELRLIKSEIIFIRQRFLGWWPPGWWNTAVSVDVRGCDFVNISFIFGRQLRFGCLVADERSVLFDHLFLFT